MLLNKFKEDSKMLQKKEATICHNHAFVVPTKLMLEFESTKPLFLILNAPHPIGMIFGMIVLIG